MWEKLAEKKYPPPLPLQGRNDRERDKRVGTAHGKPVKTASVNNANVTIDCLNARRVETRALASPGRAQTDVAGESGPRQCNRTITLA